MLTKRDKAIIKDLKEFRVLDRDQLVTLHFKGLKGAVNHCNRVMLNLVNKGEVLVDRSTRPYTYFPNPSTLKKHSAKIGHYKLIAELVHSCSKLQKPSYYKVEPTLGPKGTVEPDLILKWQGLIFFVEIQNSRYTYKVMNDKLDRYKKYYESEAWKYTAWQEEKQVFPFVWIVSEFEYTELKPQPFRVLQSENVEHFVRKYIRPPKKESAE